MKSKKIASGECDIEENDFMREDVRRATMPTRPRGERIQVIDSLDETASESLNKPPDNYISVDMGMLNVETATADRMATIGGQ